MRVMLQIQVPATHNENLSVSRIQNKASNVHSGKRKLSFTRRRKESLLQKRGATLEVRLFGGGAFQYTQAV
jgi:hypothetical protein